MKETKYAGTQTEKNLMAAFAGESEARNKYTYFASKAASRAELMCWAICSWVMRMVSEPVRSASARRNSASRRSNPLNMICCIAHITSENRFVASS